MNKLFLDLEPEFDTGNNMEYKIKAIRNKAIYIKEIDKYKKNIYQIFTI